MSKKIGSSGDGVSEKGRGWGGKDASPSPPTPYFRTLVAFVSFASGWKRKGNGCYAGHEILKLTAGLNDVFS